MRISLVMLTFRVISLLRRLDMYHLLRQAYYITFILYCLVISYMVFECSQNKGQSS
jgi:hypothetical protein